MARLALHLASAIFALSTAIVEPQMRTAGPDVSQRWIGEVRTLGEAYVSHADETRIYSGVCKNMNVI